MKKLPPKIYVSLENPGRDDEYLNAQADPNKLVEMGETNTVGEYVLKQRTEVRGEAVTLREIG